MLLLFLNCEMHCPAQNKLINQFSGVESDVSLKDRDLLTKNNLKDKYAILLKGTVRNFTGKSWMLLNEGFLGSQSIKINVLADGTFHQLIPVEGITNLHLMLNDDAVNINVEPNKIVVLSWDETSFSSSVKIDSPDALTSKNLNFNLQLYQKFRNSEISLWKFINEKSSDDKSFYDRINNLFNEELKELSTAEAAQNVFFFKIYYRFQTFLLDAGLLDDFRLTLDEANRKNKSFEIYYSQIKSNKFLSNEIFYQCPEYRDFLYRYITREELFKETNILNSVEKKNSKGEIMEEPYTLTRFFDIQNDSNYQDVLWSQYYKALSQIPINTIRDWYISNHLINSFKRQPLKEVEPVYSDFLQKCQSAVYKDTLISTFKYYKNRRNSFKAPDFTLKNEKGEKVSLSKFAGKVVYLDFWGTSCAPCLYDIKNYIPELHKRYKDEEVVFVNICIDSEEKKWKSSISDLRFGGANLIAEDLTSSQVCRDYHIDAVPHYVVIDRKGNLREINAPKPKDLLNRKTNIIDELLAE